MAIPVVLQNRLHPVTPLIGAAAAPVSRQVNVSIATQWGKRWCWASVGAGVHNKLRPPHPMLQCEVASAHHRHNICCANGLAAPPPADCDRDAALNEVFDAIGVSSANGGGTLPLADIRSEIDRDRPVACALRFPTRGYHFVIVDGYLRSGHDTTLIVRDSERGEIRMSYPSLISNYNNEGATWEWWYRVF